MRKMMIAVLVMLVGCAEQGDAAFETALRAMPEVEITHAPDAARVVESAMGIPPGALTVHWVIGVMPVASGDETIDGTAIGCEIWVSWWGAQWLSGASSDGPAISYTAFIHEAAHCALWLRDEDDPQHTRGDWWGVEGNVARTRAALIAAGL